jgi:hypothetical protein
MLLLFLIFLLQRPFADPLPLNNVDHLQHIKASAEEAEDVDAVRIDRVKQMPRQKVAQA